MFNPRAKEIPDSRFRFPIPDRAITRLPDYPMSKYLLSISAVSFARDLGFACRDREHDAEADRDESADRDPGAGDPGEDAGLPQGKRGTDHQDEVADQIDVDESHILTYRWIRTTMAARRFNRLVSSRELSCFGRS